MRFIGFESLLDRAKSMGRAKVAVAAAADKEVLEAIKLAEKEGLITPILVGDVSEIERLAKEIGFDLNGAQLVHEASPEAVAHKAVDVVVDGQAHFLMKGLINSADFLRAVLRPDRGLRTGRLLSHLSAFQVPGFPHMLYVTDGGMNIAPNLAQKKEILENSLLYLNGIGMDSVNTIVLTANEVANPKMPATMDAQALAQMSQAGGFPGAIVEGPMALDGAVSAAALKHKGISSQINGDVDLFLVSSIEVGNVLGKSLVYFAGATMAGIVLGAKVPIVLTSRNDTPRSKFMALTMAALNRTIL
ncbi:bifunctional enoyl-CoA hydratase/phosphate acetyltransferase [Desulfosporosinus fructosivorans]|uniref:Bifunctional enoyl-CoA hydratase/phosphate acetyltransferase n=1 Tax=Desulfosporosinus fructosivorans TaxID=2018669 RepID=A0A4Z0QYC1_9FIRM|nr:bifunctional enoyl-CoA hydratase/phosphate acetyltransferase [Desulfosporosinus fructosivorans]TGE35025.1 bifunctional enoyl-CoA hydratase/phosphate acetyltransferase [Desulfosporosinus fructosivorans]